MLRGGRIPRLILGVLLVATALAAAWLWSDYRRFGESALPFPPAGMVYELPAGGSTASLARDLEARGILRNALYFRLLARQEEKARGLKAGEYLIPAGTTPLALLELLGSGRVIQHSLTLVEGWTFNQVLAALRANDKITHTLDGLGATEIMARLGRLDNHPEGRFLPDTYHSPRGAEDLQVLRRAMQAMDRLLQAQWEHRAPELPLATPYQALILASIVEKETGLGSERPEIAGVFVRRLRKGMKLQTDPTVIYGLGEAFDGNLRRADLKKATPYNSYVHKGLPPTPIAMPGRAAIRAVLHPADGDSLYFVARGDGSHQFSATLAAHNRAVRKYQLNKK
jgi:UPF0755 protein